MCVCRQDFLLTLLYILLLQVTLMGWCVYSTAHIHEILHVSYTHYNELFMMIVYEIRLSVFDRETMVRRDLKVLLEKMVQE